MALSIGYHAAGKNREAFDAAECRSYNITTHSTEARVSLPFVRYLECWFHCVRARSIRALDSY
jgi:hypothetical protein